MKYIKTYEALVTLELDQKDLVKIMDNAMMDKKLILIRSLLQNKFDPDYRRQRSDNTLVLRAAHAKDIDIVKLFIEFNCDLNLKVGYSSPQKTIIEDILERVIQLQHSSTLKDAAIELERYMDIIILLIKSGAKITNPFMTELNSLRKRRNINITAEKLFNRIITEAPQEYKDYQLELTTDKYNL